MFDRALQIYFKSTSPLSLPKTQTYISTVNTRRIDSLSRYRTAPGREAYGIVLLRHVIGFALNSGILNLKTDYDRYSKCAVHIQDDMERIFDPVTSGTTRQNLFIQKNSNNTKEIVIPVHMENYLKQLPLGRGWNEWESVRPVRLLDTDSQELTFNTFQDLIVYRNSPPTRMIFSVDTISLVLQYCAFVNQRDPDKSMPIQEYLHQYVVFPFLEDLQNIWLRNRYIQLLETPEIYKTRIQDVLKSMEHNIYGYLGIQYPQMIEEVHNLYTRYSEGTNVPEKIISSLPMADGYIPDYMKRLSQETLTNDIRQNEWVEYLRDLPWLKLSCLIHKLNPEYVGYATFKRQMVRDLNIIQNTRFWNTIYDSSMRAQIKEEVENFSSLFDTK